jgi:hypothetical protein
VSSRLKGGVVRIQRRLLDISVQGGAVERLGRVTRPSPGRVGRNSLGLDDIEEIQQNDDRDRNTQNP